MSDRTYGVSITKTKWLLQFGEIITIYSENHRKHINTLNCWGFGLYPSSGFY
jgi:hypothetical protein